MNNKPISNGKKKVEDEEEEEDPPVIVVYGEGSSEKIIGIGSSSEAWNCDFEFSDEEEEGPDEKRECRICSEEDFVYNLEVPCACDGTMKFAHRNCVQRWCNEKQNIVCEICWQIYQPGYIVQLSSASVALPSSGTNHIIDMRESGGIHGTFRVLEATNLPPNEEQNTPGTGAECCRTTLMIVEMLLGCCNVVFMTLLILKNAYFLPEPSDGQLNTLCYFYVGVLVPCYLAAWTAHYCNSNNSTPPLEQNERTTSGVAIVIQSEQDNRNQQAVVVSGESQAHHFQPNNIHVHRSQSLP